VVKITAMPITRYTRDTSITLLPLLLLRIIMFTDYNTDNMQHASEKLLKPELLYQATSWSRNTFTSCKHRRSWTATRETYQNAARREYELLLANPRQANHEIVVGYLKEFFIRELLEQFMLIKERLLEYKIIAYYVVEITEDGNGKPANRMHYHFFIEGKFSIRKLRDIYKDACQYAGLHSKDYKVNYYPIPDRKTFERKSMYTLKYDKYAGQAILFQPHTGINKVGSIGWWFINPDGTKANKDAMWKSIVAGWYSGNSTHTQQQAIEITFQFTIPCSCLLGGIKSIFFQERKLEL
jgi:hypothetical protein